MQVYALPAGAPADESKRLPSPSEVVTTLKPCQIVIPFEFKLPERIPPSIEHGRSFVRYSIYSCIDVEWKKDPSTRAFFTVLTRNPIEFMYPHVPQPMHGSSESQKPLPRCCGLLPGKKQEGKMTLLITTTRKGFAPGELIPLDIQVHNKSSKPASLSVSLMRHFRGETFKGISRWAQEICSLDAHHEVLPGEKTNVVGELLLPPIPPTFKGSDPAYMEDLRWLVRHPRGERWAPAEGMKGHPISWHYKIEADVTTEGPGPTVSHAMDVTILAFPPCAAPDVQILGKAVEPSSSWVADKPRAAPVVVYVPDPHQGPMNVGDPLLDMHSFKAEALVWAPLCPLSKPGAWPEAEAPLPAARALQPV